MSESSLPSISHDHFKASWASVDGAMTLTLTGAADAIILAELGALVGSIHVEAIRLDVREVRVDLRKLDFMNSSCFKSLVSWLSTLRELPEKDRYKVCVMSDGTRHWQRRSLAALVAFGGGVAEVRT